MVEAGKIVSIRKMNNWVKAIVNHFHYVTDNSEPQSTLRAEMWHSLLNHVTNVHTHPSNTIYKSCIHEEIREKLVDGELHQPDWMLPGEHSFHLLHMQLQQYTGLVIEGGQNVMENLIWYCSRFVIGPRLEIIRGYKILIIERYCGSITLC